jgi:hypothetical protein
MATAKQRSQQHLIDQQGEELLRSRLPSHWIMREYRPDYGLDFAIEVFKPRGASTGRPVAYETLGEHLFVQLKSVAQPVVKPLTIFGRGNVEKGPEHLDRTDKVAEIDTYRYQLEISELITVERMGIGVPVLLVIADLKVQRCSFVCLNDYIDKILRPRNKIFTYDFWDDTEMCALIPYNAAGLKRFMETGQPGYFKEPKSIPEGFEEAEYRAHMRQLDVFELWRQLALLPKTFEDVWREWFLPTALGHIASAP